MAKPWEVREFWEKMLFRPKEYPWGCVSPQKGHFWGSLFSSLFGLFWGKGVKTSFFGPFWPPYIERLGEKSEEIRLPQKSPFWGEVHPTLRWHRWWLLSWLIIIFLIITALLFFVQVYTLSSIFRFTHPAPLRARGEPAPVLRLAAVQTQKKGKSQNFKWNKVLMMMWWWW